MCGVERRSVSPVRGERLDERSERRHRDAGAEQARSARDARPAHAEREALQRVRIGGYRRDRVQDFVATVDQPVAAAGREIAATVEAHAKGVGALQLEVHDDRFDEDLPPRLVEPVDHRSERRVVAERRRDDERVGGLVGAHLDAALEHPRRGVGAPSGRAAPRLAALRAGDDVAKRLRELHRVGVLKRQDVDLPLAGLRHVEPLHQLEDAQVRLLGRHDDDGVRALVGHDLRDAIGAMRGALGRRPLRRRSVGRAAARALHVEQLVHALGDVGSRRVVDGLDEDLLAGAPHVDLLEQVHHPADVRARVGDDEQVARRVHRDVSVLRLELAEHVGRVVGAHVGQAVDAGDVAVLRGGRLRGAVDRRALRDRSSRLDDLEEAAVGHHREAVRFQDGKERLVGLGDGDLLRRVDRRLDGLELAAEDEALARELGYHPHELGEIGVVERERHEVVRAPRLVLHALLELREAGGVPRDLAVREEGAGGASRGRRRRGCQRPARPGPGPAPHPAPPPPRGASRCPRECARRGPSSSSAG